LSLTNDDVAALGRLVDKREQAALAAGPSITLIRRVIDEFLQTA
jgi:hypothetical protein